MIARKKDGAIYLHGFSDPRDLTEARKLSRPDLTAAKRREGLISLIRQAAPEMTVEPSEEIFVWA